MKKVQFPCGHSSSCPTCASDARKRSYVTSGRCYECGKRKESEERLRCFSCLHKAKERRHRREEDYISQHRCGRCGAQLDGKSNTRCLRCLAYAAKWIADYKQKKKGAK